MFKTLGKYLPPPAGAKSPAMWGTRARLTEMFDAGGSVKAESRLFNFRYRSPEHFLDVFKTYYGPVLKAFAALEPAKQEELHNDLHALIVRMNRAGNGSLVVPERISRSGDHEAMTLHFISPHLVMPACGQGRRERRVRGYGIPSQSCS